MSNKDSDSYPPFEFVAAGARPRALVSKVVRRRQRASSWDAINHPNNIGKNPPHAGDTTTPPPAPAPTLTTSSLLPLAVAPEKIGVGLCVCVSGIDMVMYLGLCVCVCQGLTW
jgi:hypothetical protein